MPVRRGTSDRLLNQKLNTRRALGEKQNFLDAWKEKILDYQITRLHPGSIYEKAGESVESTWRSQGAVFCWGRLGIYVFPSTNERASLPPALLPTLRK